VSEILQDADAAVDLARNLLRRSRELQTAAEREEQAAINRLIQHPEDKATLVEMTDQAFRAHDPARIADQLSHVLVTRGIPRSFGPLDRAMLAAFRSLGPLLPGVTVPLVLDKMRSEAEGKVRFVGQDLREQHADTDALRNYLASRHRESVRINLNFLGEAVLSEAESLRRVEQYLAALRLPEVECISAKISTLYSQVSLLAHERTCQVLGERLERLIRTAHATLYTRPNGQRVPKFVYLDMEEYRDMRITVRVLRAVLDRPGMELCSAGVALQAYLPDALEVLDELAAWAIRRRNQGGAPITIRLVKGANLEMERVEAAIEGWPQAPFLCKAATDAHWKRMLRKLLDPQLAGAVRVGIASHNLFDLALGLVWSKRFEAFDRVQFEMLEGMADHQRRALGELSGDLLLYAPTCKESDFVSAIGYLFRRLDENTVAENFLRHAFDLQEDSPAWKSLEAAFRQAVTHSILPPPPTNRTQDRSVHVVQTTTSFTNEPNTDWSRPANIRWWESVRADWYDRHGDTAAQVPLVIAGKAVNEARPEAVTEDPSRPGTIICRTTLAEGQDIQAAIDHAILDLDGWGKRTASERRETFQRAAHLLRQRRGDLLGAAMACGGKTVTEGDPEVSEAVDFVEYYAGTAEELGRRTSLNIRPRGIVVVVSPWNFPIAIPCGGIAAALAAGNTVILKPATDTVLAASIVCRCFWEAGVPASALQLIPCDAKTASVHLVTDRRVASLILTGGTSTAENMLERRPGLDLWAETGGKNGTIVTRLADRDLAIKHVLQSAFGHSGQKCSATSLLLLERELYDDASFQRSLVEAAASLTVGSAWDPATRVGPLIRPPSGALERSLRNLETGERWALEPQVDPQNCRLWSPGIKWNVTPGSFTHLTELFGPVLGVMPFDRLEEAIERIHQTGFGLTSGIQSLDDREQAQWTASIRAGNLYVNRPTTGAMVLRQPFGGFGKSAIGTGIKAGGPNYLIPLLDIEDARSIPDKSPTRESDMEECLESALASYREWVDREFGRDLLHDNFQLLGQDNFRRYQPAKRLVIRVTKGDTLLDALRATAAAIALSIDDVYLSLADDLPGPFADSLRRKVARWSELEVVSETAEALVEWIDLGQVERLRYLRPEGVEDSVRQVCRARFLPLAERAVTSDGRIEMVWYVQEQSISRDYHRYGNLGRRANSNNVVRAEERNLFR
jgi:RHH-type proline utilization regulon transcriptional repressor/proline dehydrogenase/delta 1-pyrroline-5-carboxylate dehydrogenase